MERSIYLRVSPPGDWKAIYGGVSAGGNKAIYGGIYEMSVGSPYQGL